MSLACRKCSFNFGLFFLFQVSYMVVKADPSLKKVQADQNNKTSGVFNRTGPWICSTCDADRPIVFDTYFNYRKHLRVCKTKSHLE